MNKVNQDVVDKFKSNLGDGAIQPKSADEIIEAMLLCMRVAADLRSTDIDDPLMSEKFDLLGECDDVADVLIWVLGLGKHFQHDTAAEKLVSRLKQFQELTPVQRVKLFNANDMRREVGGEL